MFFQTDNIDIASYAATVMLLLQVTIASDHNPCTHSKFLD